MIDWLVDELVFLTNGLIHWFRHLIIDSFIALFILSFIHYSLFKLSIIHSFIALFILSFSYFIIYPFIHSLHYSSLFIHCIIHPFIHSFHYSSFRRLIHWMPDDFINLNQVFTIDIFRFSFSFFSDVFLIKNCWFDHFDWFDWSEVRTCLLWISWSSIDLYHYLILIYV